LSNPRKIKSL